MSRSIALGIAFSIIAATNGFAAPNCSALVQSQGCTCAAPISPGTPVGQLSGVEGDVQKSGTRGYTPVKFSAPVNIGDGLLLGETGKALLTVGLTCQQSLGPQTSVFVRAIGGCACVNTVDRRSPPLDHSNAPQAAAASPGAGTVFVAAAIGGGTVAFLLLHRSSPPISP